MDALISGLKGNISSRGEEIHILLVGGYQTRKLKQTLELEGEHLIIDEAGNDELNSRFWRATMFDGIVNFIRPEECIRKFVKKMKSHPPESFGLKEESLKELLLEEGIK